MRNSCIPISLKYLYCTRAFIQLVYDIQVYHSFIKLWQQMLSEVYWFTYGTVFRWFLCYSVFLPLKIFVSSTPPRRFEIQHCNFAWSLVMVWSYVHRDNFLFLRSNMAAGLPSLNFGYFVIKAYGYFWTWKNETTIMCVCQPNVLKRFLNKRSFAL